MRCSLLTLAVVLATWLTAAAASAAPVPATDPLGELRLRYFAAVQDGAALARAREEIERVRAAHRPAVASELDAVLTAYAGALTTLEAKHALWPQQKLRHLREGLAVLDRVVRSRPDAVEARYLRLMSCYYLPSFLGRSGSVREDLLALARLLPPARSRYPAELYRAIATFVLEHGEIPAADRSALGRSLAR